MTVNACEDLEGIFNPVNLTPLRLSDRNHASTCPCPTACNLTINTVPKAYITANPGAAPLPVLQ